MAKPKPTIMPIVTPNDKLQFLKEKINDPDLSQSSKRDFIKEIMHGECVTCQGMPEKIERYDMDVIWM